MSDAPIKKIDFTGGLDKVISDAQEVIREHLNDMPMYVDAGDMMKLVLMKQCTIQQKRAVDDYYLNMATVFANTSASLRTCGDNDVHDSLTKFLYTVVGHRISFMKIECREEYVKLLMKAALEVATTFDKVFDQVLENDKKMHLDAQIEEAKKATKQ